LRRRTIFNMLGPLTNPASAPYQLIGVYTPELTVKIAEAAHRLGSKKVWVVHSNDGLDEVSVCAETQVAEASEEGVRSFEFKPLKKNLGLPEGGSPSQNAALIQAVLDGSVSGPARDIVILNAAVALHIATGESLTGSIQKAEESISRGAAFEKLKSVISFYRDWK
jgi:anthranilate phosphoribosyltransferase